MKIRLYFLLYMIMVQGPVWLVEDNQLHQEQVAQAFFAAKDYNRARSFYEKKLDQTMPKWQEALVHYNLSTINLAEKHWKEALSLLHAIPIDSISSPRLLENLMMNQALAYLEESQSTNDKDLQINFLQESLQNLKKTQTLYCQVQKLEEPLLAECHNPNLLALFYDHIAIKQRQVRQEQRDEFLKEGNLYIAIGLFKEALDRFLAYLNGLQSSSNTTSLKQQYVDRIHNLAEAINPLWQNLSEQSVVQEQKQSIDVALNKYLEAIKLIFQKDWKNGIALLKKVQDELEGIQSKLDPKQVLFQGLLIDYRIALTREHLLSASIEKILEKQKTAAPLLEAKDVVELSTSHLVKSMEHLETGQQKLGRFFFLAAYYKLEEASQTTTVINNPEKALYKAIQEGNRAFELNRLSYSADEPVLQKESQEIIKEAQSKTMQFADKFLAILKDKETERYQKIGAIEYPRCQNRPWDQVVPLFEKGHDYALLAQEGIEQGQNQLAIITNQEQTVLYWQRALDLLREWVESVNKNLAQANEENLTPSNVKEIFQSLQEMHLDDSVEPSKPQKELHSW